MNMRAKSILADWLGPLIALLLVTIMYFLAPVIFLRDSQPAKNKSVAPAIATPVEAEPEDTLDPDEILRLVNNHRESIGLNKLTVSEKLVASAKAKCLDMQENNYFAHDRPNGDKPWVFFKQQGITQYTALGENLAQFPSSDESDIVEGWLDSPTHKKEMESNRTLTGIYTCAMDVDWERPGDTKFTVQHFMLP